MLPFDREFPFCLHFNDSRYVFVIVFVTSLLLCSHFPLKTR